MYLRGILTAWNVTLWGRTTHICASKLTIIVSDNGLSLGRRQAIIWTNDGILLIETLGTNFNEILIKIHSFSFKNIHLKISPGKWRPLYLGLNVLRGRSAALLPGRLTNNSAFERSNFESRSFAKSSMKALCEKHIQCKLINQLPIT